MDRGADGRHPHLRRSFEADFKVKIPIMGAKIEQRAAAWVDRLLANSEVRSIEEVLAGK